MAESETEVAALTVAAEHGVPAPATLADRGRGLRGVASLAVAADQGRTDLDGPTLNARRDEFLTAALNRL